MPLPSNLQGPGLFQSAASLAAIRVASKIDPSTIAKVGRAVGAVQSFAQLIGPSGAFLTTPLPLLGGISLAKAKEIHEKVRKFEYARKNFFFIQVASPDLASQIEGFDFFAVDVAYSPVQVAGESIRIGAGCIDDVQGAERIDLRITTFDDQAGTLKHWFRDLARRVARSADGTFKTPSQYCIDFTIVHAVVDGYVSGGGPEPYRDVLRMRPVGFDVDISRREAGLQEIQMNFAQVDTFMGPPDAPG